MAIPFDPPVVDLTPQEATLEREVYGGLTASVRRLMEASMRTTVDPDEVTETTRLLDDLSTRLEKQMVPGNLGLTVTSDGHARAHGNAVVGMRNPSPYRWRSRTTRLDGRHRTSTSTRSTKAPRGWSTAGSSR